MNYVVSLSGVGIQFDCHPVRQLKYIIY